MKRKVSNKGELVVVKWGDAHSGASWISHEEAVRRHAPAIVTTCGYVIAHDSEGISLAQGVAEDGSVVGMFFIPKGMIIKITR